jgi:signal transduction histidine kinase
VRREDSVAVVSIKDQGMGIAIENRERIFNRFERVVSDRNANGLGLGLYITRQIIEAHKGSISVESEVGKGSTFTFSIPTLRENER